MIHTIRASRRSNGILVVLYSISLVSNALAQRVRFANGVSGMFSKKVRPPVIEKLALSDTVGKEWLSYGSRRMETSAGRKFAQIKTIMLAYQKWQSFGKFDYYGCYCFTEGMNLAYGRGNPVDEIDSACKRWFTCYQCAEMDARLSNESVTCDGRDQPYKFFADKDDLGLPKVGCNMNGGHDTCSRATCECDAEFIKALSKHEATYNIEYHRIWGSFDYSICSSPTKQAKHKSSPARARPQLRSAAQESLTIQLDKSEKSKGGREDRGIVDACCVTEYPRYQLYRSRSQHCCLSQVKYSQSANVFHLNTDDEDEKNHFVCCKDGTVVKKSSECKAGLHTEF